MNPVSIRPGETAAAHHARLAMLRASVGRDGARSNYLARGAAAHQGKREKARRVRQAMRDAINRQLLGAS